MLLWVLLGVICLWPVILKLTYPDRINGTEMALHFVLPLLVTGIVWYAGTASKTHAVELWNGEVTGKSKDIVPCIHAYQCNCRMRTSGFGKKRRTRRVCDTCFYHPFDIDWNVRTNVGNFTVNRVEWQGIIQPPRWTQVQNGQPAALPHSYTDYVRGSKDSAFHKEELELASLPDVPPYPQVYDYHYAKRVLTVGVTLPDAEAWNTQLADALKVLGPKRQMNLIIVIAATPDQKFRHKVEAAWKGTSKNDEVVVIGTDKDGKTILWADVITWASNTGNQELRIHTRNALLDAKTIDREKVMAVVLNHATDHYHRPSMEEFEYLKWAIEPSTWVQILLALLVLAGNALLSWLFHRHDVRLSDMAETALDFVE